MYHRMPANSPSTFSADYFHRRQWQTPDPIEKWSDVNSMHCNAIEKMEFYLLFLNEWLPNTWEWENTPFPTVHKYIRALFTGWRMEFKKKKLSPTLPSLLSATQRYLSLFLFFSIFILFIFSVISTITEHRKNQKKTLRLIQSVEYATHWGNAQKFCSFLILRKA